MVGLLDDLFSTFDELVVKRKLEKIKTIGDAYMVAGGLTDPDSDHARRVVDLRPGDAGGGGSARR